MAASPCHVIASLRESVGAAGQFASGFRVGNGDKDAKLPESDKNSTKIGVVVDFTWDSRPWLLKTVHAEATGL
jgi:hypothetical protein